MVANIRPSLMSLDVAFDVVTSVAAEIEQWAETYFENKECNEYYTFRGMLGVSLRDSHYDVTIACAELHSMQYPVDDALAQILRGARTRRESFHTQRVHEWVMANKIRLPTTAKEGAIVTFKIATAELSGTIKARIAREARLIVEMGNGANISVPSEDIVSVKPAPKKGKSTPPTGPNNGGTPVAARQAKVA